MCAGPTLVLFLLLVHYQWLASVGASEDVRTQAWDSGTPSFYAAQVEGCPLMFFAHFFMFQSKTTPFLRIHHAAHFFLFLFLPPLSSPSFFCRSFSQGGHVHVLQWLFANGASSDVALDARFGGRPLSTAVSQGHLQAVKWLILHGGANSRVEITTTAGDADNGTETDSRIFETSFSASPSSSSLSPSSTLTPTSFPVNMPETAETTSPLGQGSSMRVVAVSRVDHTVLRSCGLLPQRQSIQHAADGSTISVVGDAVDAGSGGAENGRRVGAANEETPDDDGDDDDDFIRGAGSGVGGRDEAAVGNHQQRRRWQPLSIAHALVAWCREEEEKHVAFVLGFLLGLILPLETKTSESKGASMLRPGTVISAVATSSSSSSSSSSSCQLTWENNDDGINEQCEQRKRRGKRSGARFGQASPSFSSSSTACLLPMLNLGCESANTALRSLIADFAGVAYGQRMRNARDTAALISSAYDTPYNTTYRALK
jgi:hypothetical protein